MFGFGRDRDRGDDDYHRPSAPPPSGPPPGRSARGNDDDNEYSRPSGSPYNRRNDEYGSGRANEQSSYGGSYGRQSDSYGSSGYGQQQQSSYGHGRKGSDSDSDSDNKYKKNSGHQRKDNSYGSSGYGKQQGHDRRGSNSDDDNKYKNSSYGRQDNSYGSSGYGQQQGHGRRGSDSDDDNKYKKNSGYGQQQSSYGDNSNQGGYGGGHKSKSSYGESNEGRYNQSSGYGGNSNQGYGRQETQSSGYGRQDNQSSGYGRQDNQSSGYGRQDNQSSGYGRQDNQSSGYGRQDNQSSGYGRQEDQSYGGDESNQQYSLPSYGKQKFSNQVDDYNYQYSNCKGKRKALLIGINYIGTKNELKGCINDVQNVSKFLQEKYGYKEEDMVILTDDSNSKAKPTKETILKGCQWLTKDAQPNDALFFHYSGHGGQVADESGDEQDGNDECIYPLDFEKNGEIVDDVLHKLLVSPLQAGVRLTCLFDSCHSGTVLDIPYVYSTKGLVKEPNILVEAGKGLLSSVQDYAAGNYENILNNVTSLLTSVTIGNTAYEKTKQTNTSPADVVLISGCKDDQTSADAKENGASTGAMSYAFLTVMKKNSNQSYLSLLNNMRTLMKEKYKQKPQLSSCHPIDTSLKFIM